MRLSGEWHFAEFSALTVLQWCGLDLIAVDLLVDPIDIVSHNRLDVCGMSFSVAMAAPRHELNDKTEVVVLGCVADGIELFEGRNDHLIRHIVGRRDVKEEVQCDHPAMTCRVDDEFQDKVCVLLTSQANLVQPFRCASPRSLRV